MYFLNLNMTVKTGHKYILKKNTFKLKHNHNLPILTENFLASFLSIAEADNIGRGVENCEIGTVFVFSE